MERTSLGGGGSGMKGGGKSNLMRMDMGMDFGGMGVGAGGLGGLGGGLSVGGMKINSAPGDASGLFGNQQAQLAALMGVNGNVNLNAAAGQNGLNLNNLNMNGLGGMSVNGLGGLDQGGNNGTGSGLGMNDQLALQQQLLLQQQQQQQMRMQQSLGMDTSLGGNSGAPGDASGLQNALENQQNLMLQQQLQMMQQMQNLGSSGVAGIGNGNDRAMGNTCTPVPSNAAAMTDMASSGTGGDMSGSVAQKMRKDEQAGLPDNIGIKKSVTKHLSKLEKSSVFGNRLRSHYSLAIDTLFNLPPVPSDEEYCAKLNANMTPAMLPPFDVAALRAARFAEIALGALVDNQTILALELSNATVVCLKQCAEEPVHPSCMFDVAKAYFLLGMFRSYRGDMQRYFQYRRVCLAKLSQVGKKTVGIQQLLSTISFHDSWAYMIYNANADDLPDIDGVIPELPNCGNSNLSSRAEQKYQTSTDHTKISSDPLNQMWMQGTPAVFINNEAPPLSRALDALACAVRTCCDQANSQFAQMGCYPSSGNNGNGSKQLTATGLAVTSNENELCSRNMVLSAYALVQQSENTNANGAKLGHSLIISAMDGFLESGEGEEGGSSSEGSSSFQGFTESQIQSFLTVCNITIENPHLLHQGGPTYHMVSNAAVMLCHIMNALYADKHASPMKPNGDMEVALFNEILDTYIAVRKLLNAHRRKIPVLLRCHGLPRPNLLHSTRYDSRNSSNSSDTYGGNNNDEEDQPFINLGDCNLCSARGCQGFVLMACSPCVAAERAQAASASNQQQQQMSESVDDLGFGFDETLNGLGDEVDLDDEALLKVLGKIVAA